MEPQVTESLASAFFFFFLLTESASVWLRVGQRRNARTSTLRNVCLHLSFCFFPLPRSTSCCCCRETCAPVCSYSSSSSEWKEKGAPAAPFFTQRHKLKPRVHSATSSNKGAQRCGEFRLGLLPPAARSASSSTSSAREKEEEEGGKVDTLLFLRALDAQGTVVADRRSHRLPLPLSNTHAHARTRARTQLLARSLASAGTYK